VKRYANRYSCRFLYAIYERSVNINSYLAEGLIEEGHEVFIITPKYKGYKVYDKDYDYIKRVSGGIVLPKKGVRFLKYIPLLVVM